MFPFDHYLNDMSMILCVSQVELALEQHGVRSTKHLCSRKCVYNFSSSKSILKAYSWWEGSLTINMNSQLTYSL